MEFVAKKGAWPFLLLSLGRNNPKQSLFQRRRKCTMWSVLLTGAFHTEVGAVGAQFNYWNHQWHLPSTNLDILMSNDLLNLNCLIENIFLNMLVIWGNDIWFMKWDLQIVSSCRKPIHASLLVTFLSTGCSEMAFKLKWANENSMIQLDNPCFQPAKSK